MTGRGPVGLAARRPDRVLVFVVGLFLAGCGDTSNPTTASHGTGAVGREQDSRLSLTPEVWAEARKISSAMDEKAQYRAECCTWSFGASRVQFPPPYTAGKLCPESQAARERAHKVPLELRESAQSWGESVAGPLEGAPTPMGPQ